MEDELRDPKNFMEYFLPRPLRLAFFGFSAASCFVAALLTAARLIQEPALELDAGTGLRDLIINVSGLAAFAALFFYDQKQAEVRVEKRRQIRQAQVRMGDREVFVNEQGEKMSRLKEVDDEWVLRRLERWGRKDNMPFVGPKKGAILKRLVAEQRPQLAVEVGTMAGYSALLIAQALPPGGRLISYEKEWSWALTAKRFAWQASQGESNKARAEREGVRTGDKIDVRVGDAAQELRKLVPGRDRIGLLFLDGVPKEYLSYLQAAEPCLEPGALVIADNAGVFAQGGLKPYLEYVRGGSGSGSGKYESEFVASKLEWRDDVDDGLEVSRYLGAAAGQRVKGGQEQGVAASQAA